MSKINIVPVFVPHYGCPNDCVFCNQRKITNQNYIKDFKDTKKSIDEYLNYFSNPQNKTQIAFYGGSFTGLPKEIMEQFLDIGRDFIKQGRVNSLRLSTRPDYIDDKILKLLKQYKVDTIELGVQSIVDEVLIANRRNHLSDVVYSASKLIKNYNFKLGLQQMLGLYMSNEDRDIYTTKEFIKIKPDFVRIYPTLVITDSFLEKLYKTGKYTPYTLDDTIALCKLLYCNYYSNGIDVIRIGLQPTDNITLGKDVVAGPFHPSIRQLTLQGLYRDFISLFIKDFYKESVEIYINNKELNYLVGNKGVNKKFFIENFKLRGLKIKPDYRDNILIKSGDRKIEITLDEYLREKSFIRG